MTLPADQRERDLAARSANSRRAPNPAGFSSQRLRGGTLFSGIGAPEVSAPGIDWRWGADIDDFANAVRAHHWPHVPNLGDVSEIDHGRIEPVDVLVFGSPCQSFSVAGKRLGLDDPRGNLALVALALAAKLRPRWLVFENVPGLLSSDDGRDFQAFVRTATERGYSLAWRVLDAQFAGVPQRRRRVFAVGHLGDDWRPSAAVLFEPESLQGHPPPRREAGQRIADSITVGANQYSGFPGEPVEMIASTGSGRWPAEVAPTLNARPTGGDGLGTDFDLDGGLFCAEIAGALNTANGKTRPGDTPQCAQSGHMVAFGGNNTAGPIDVSAALNAHGGPVGRLDFESETFVAFSCKDHGADAGDTSPTLRAMGHDGSHMNGGGQVAAALLGTMVRRLTPTECERLQGFPDGFTDIPWRGKRAPDSRRYKALGNSMAVPVIGWILDRIHKFELGSTAEARGARPDAVGEPYPGTVAEKARTYSETRRQTARAGPAEGAKVKGGETVPVTGTATEFQGHHASPVTLSNNRRGGSPR